MHSPTVRPARPDDARPIASVHVASWRAAYRGIVPDDVLGSLSVEARARDWSERITSRDFDEGRLWVVEAPADVVGFAYAGPSRDPDADSASTGEIYAIYVDPPKWGSGLGRALLDHATTDLTQRGYERATLWVFEDNESGRAFYERAGWEADGSRKEGRYAPEIRYVKDLADAST